MNTRKLLLLLLAMGYLAAYGQNKPLDDSQPENSYVSDIIELKELDSLAYYSLKEAVNPQKESIKAITDMAEVRRLLKGVAVWGITTDSGEAHESADGELLVKLTFRNGKVHAYGNNNDYDEQFFIAYYPQEDILLLEGGHTTDVSYNLSTGEATEDVGNPSYFVFSPSKKHRLNGHYNGQECSSYFIQQKDGSRYKKIVQLDEEFENITGIWLCTIHDSFWSDDEMLNLLTSMPINNGRDTQLLYYQIVLKN